MERFHKTSRKYETEVEVSGHLIDSMILTRIFDRIMDLKGEFEVIEFRIGKSNKDHSYAKLAVKGRTAEHLDKLLKEVYSSGAVPTKLSPVKYRPAPKDSVLPENFSSTTNHPTQIYLNDHWINIEKPMMDKAVVVYPKENRAVCKAILEVRKDELVVVGEEGLRITPPERPREGVDVFQFMSNQSSIERPTLTIARKIARDMHSVHSSGGKIVVVPGPAVIHTGSGMVLAKLIRKGYFTALLSGNALAVHDVELSLFGTSLGLVLADGTASAKGYRNHIAAINEIFKWGSLRKMVRGGALKKGVMYECIVGNVPYVLAGSIRDDGPIPDVLTDMVEAQQQYKERLADVDIVLMLSTMLHSIAVGNMLSSDVKTIAVDINPSVVTKLLDRGTRQAIGIVSDIATFLPTLARELEKLEGLANRP